MKGFKIGAIITLVISALLFLIEIPIYTGVVQGLFQEVEEGKDAVDVVATIIIFLPFYLLIGVPSIVCSALSITFGWVRFKKGGSKAFSIVMTCIGGFIIFALIFAFLILFFC